MQPNQDMLKNSSYTFEITFLRVVCFINKNILDANIYCQEIVYCHYNTINNKL